MKRITMLKRAKNDLEEISRVYHRNRNILLYDNPQSYTIETDNEDEGCMELVTPIDSFEAFKENICDVFKKYEWPEDDDFDEYEYDFWRLEKGIDAMKNYYILLNIDDKNAIDADGNDTGIRTINIFDLKYNLRKNLKDIDDGEYATESLIKQINEDIEKEKTNK